MKRPQFGLRLLLLLVALAATSFAWIQAVDQARRQKKVAELETVRAQIRNLESMRNGPPSNIITVEQFDDMIAERRQKLKSLQD
jgi:hypothetical protein